MFALLKWGVLCESKKIFLNQPEKHTHYINIADCYINELMQHV